MKKQIVSLFAVLLSASYFFFACNSTVNQGVGNLKFDNQQENRTEHLFGDTTKPACNLVIDFTYVASSNNEQLKDTLNSYFIAFCLGNRYISLAPTEAIRQYVKQYTDDYRKDLEPMFQKDEQEQEYQEEIPAWYSYYRSIESDVQYYHKQLLTYRYRYEEYTGGAHGIYMTSFLNLNLETMTPVRLADLFVNDYEEPLTDLLWNQLMADHKVTTHEALEEIGYATTGRLEPTENFFLTPEGITFYYNVYEITPYAMGPVEITLPYDAMEHLLDDTYSILKSIRK